MNDFRFGHIPHLAVVTGEKSAWIGVGMTVDTVRIHLEDMYTSVQPAAPLS